MNSSTLIQFLPYGTNASHAWVDPAYSASFQTWAYANHLTAQELTQNSNRDGYLVNATPQQLESMIESWLSSLSR
jgi:hypothetical protein